MNISELQLLKEKLGKGFYVENLYEMASLCKRLAKDSAYALAFHVLWSIFIDIARDWDGRPLPVDEATKVQQKLEAPIREVIQRLEAFRNKQELFDSLTKLVAAHMQAISLQLR